MTGATHPAAGEVRAMLAAFVKSPWRDVHLRSADWELFLAKPDGAANPMRSGVASATPGAAAERTDTMDAPHLGLFFASVTAGQRVRQGDPVGELEVLGEREPIAAPYAGRVVAVLAEEGALVEYGAALISLSPS